MIDMSEQEPSEEVRTLAIPSWHGARSVEEYAAGVKAGFDLTPIYADDDPGSYHVDGWHTPHGLFLQLRTGTFSFQRRKSQMESSNHIIVVERFLRGGWSASFGDQVLLHRPGPIFFLDSELNYSAIMETGLVQQLYVDKATLGYDPDTHPRFHKTDATSLIGCCLGQTWDEVYHALQADPLAMPVSLLDQLVAIIKIALGANPQRGDVRTHARQALHGVITSYIEKNLGASELTPERVLAQFGVSRASLYRMFEPYGGVQNYIMERRTHRAVLDLARNPSARGVVQRVADRWGFSSGPNFNRAVRNRFGSTPGNLIRPTRAPTTRKREAASLAGYLSQSQSKAA